MSWELQKGDWEIMLLLCQRLMLPWELYNVHGLTFGLNGTEDDWFFCNVWILLTKTSGMEEEDLGRSGLPALSCALLSHRIILVVRNNKVFVPL